MPASAATERALCGSASAIATTSAPDTEALSTRTCVPPISPAPITPTRSVMGSSFWNRLRRLRLFSALPRMSSRRAAAGLAHDEFQRDADDAGGGFLGAAQRGEQHVRPELTQLAVVAR